MEIEGLPFNYKELVTGDDLVLKDTKRKISRPLKAALWTLAGLVFGLGVVAIVLYVAFTSRTKYYW